LGCASGQGTVFTIGATGLATLHHFSYSDGANPQAALIQASDGRFYGMTPAGGTTGLARYSSWATGSIPAATLTTLHHFNGVDGAYPLAGLIQSTDGSLYGTTSEGGPDSTSNRVVFRVTLNTPPVTTDDSYSTPEDTMLTVDGPGVLANGGPTHGALALSRTAPSPTRGRRTTTARTVLRTKPKTVRGTRL
jgi:hypothetical protein